MIYPSWQKIDLTDGERTLFSEKDRVDQWENFQQEEREIKTKKREQSVLRYFLLQQFFQQVDQQLFIQHRSDEKFYQLDNRYQPYFLKRFNDQQAKEKRIYCSLSHSKNYIALAYAHHPLGIDIEWQDRKLSWRTQQFIYHSADHQMNPLILWACKEAAFKAIFIKQKKRVRLKNIWCNNLSFGISNNILGNLTMIKQDHLVIIVAQML